MIPIYKVEYIIDQYGDGLGIIFNKISIFIINNEYFLQKDRNSSNKKEKLTKSELDQIINQINISPSCHFFYYNEYKPINYGIEYLRSLSRELSIDSIVLQ